MINQAGTGDCLSLVANGANAHINFSGDPANSSPADGDLWFDGTDFKWRVGTTTRTASGKGSLISSATRTTAAGSGTVSVTTTFKPRAVLVNVTFGAGRASSGWSVNGTDGCIAWQTGGAYTQAGYALYEDEGSGNGWTGICNNFTATGFDIVFTETGVASNNATYTVIAIE